MSFARSHLDPHKLKVKVTFKNSFLLFLIMCKYLHIGEVPAETLAWSQHCNYN